MSRSTTPWFEKIRHPWLVPQTGGIVLPMGKVPTLPKDRNGVLLTEQDVIARLRDRVAREGGTFKTAGPRLGVSDALLSAVLSTQGFRRKIGPQILKVLRLHRVVMYEPIAQLARRSGRSKK